MQTAEVHKAVILPFPSPGGQFNSNEPWYALENHYLIQAAEYSNRFIPFPGVNPGDERSVRIIQQMVNANGIKGVKFSHQIPMKFCIDNLIDHPLMKIVRDNNLLMMIHVGTGKEKNADRTHTTLPYAIKVAQKYPEVQFIFCHLGRLHWQLLEALELNNVVTDTSGLALQSHWSQFVAKEPMATLRNLKPVEIIEKLVDLGHADKIVFGSDEPYTSYELQVGQILDAKISPSAKQRILNNNFQRLL